MIIKRLAVDNLLPGMITAGDVYGKNGLLIANGETLNESIIAHMPEHGIMFIPVREDSIKEAKQKLQSATVKKPNLNDLSVIKETEEYKEFTGKYDNITIELKDRLTFILKNSAKIDSQALINLVEELESVVDSPERLMDMLRCLREYDDQTFAHSVNVSLIAGVCAKWLKFSEEGIEQVKLAGLLHDIGKMQLPKEIVQKPGRLTEDEFEIVKLHPMLGYDLLRGSDLNNEIKLAALQHHEKCDGSGYPDGIGYDKISMTAKIIAIADVYDAMTAARSYRAAICPFDVINTIYTDAFSKYEFGYVSKFMKNIATTYRNRTVNLSNGERGEIMFIGDNNPARPIIMTGNGLIDLSARMDLKITEVL